ncbi:MAG: hypothetical protein II411_02795 [Lachnospiraceae bacterium]|nr:hypothetical protein [Lachnospiraceae bacterium]
MKKISLGLILALSIMLVSACGNKNVCSKDGCNQPTYQDGLCRDHWNERQANNVVGNVAGAVNSFFGN